jgi:hypothetical protein
VDKVQKPSDSDTNTIIPMNSNLKFYLLVLNTFQTNWLTLMEILLLEATPPLDILNFISNTKINIACS